MKTILIADWHMSAMCNLVAQSAQQSNREYRFVNSENMDNAVASLSEIIPDVMISQPSLLMQDDFRLLKTASKIQPLPKLLVWWGSKVAFDAFREQCDYPSAVSYIELPCNVKELLQQIDALLA
jgi:hypothetical protein